jgi:pyrroloquinoline quinone (PQQ) biosynthesis protein C/mannose-6-phosphate isomerase-like protein (cupin superfamily)
MGKFTVSPSVQKQIIQLNHQKDNHSFWNNKLFSAGKQGLLTFEDWRYVFSQYYLYNKNFTRYLTAIMTNCENDYYRSRLSENLWEEGGGAKPEERHAELFRKFLVQTLQIKDLNAIEFADSSRLFANEYLSRCIQRDPAYGTALLSLGTEGIVSRMYSILVECMTKAGIPDSELTFFHLHIGCDDEHAETLAEMMASFSDMPGWYEICAQATDDALTLRENFFNSLTATILTKRLEAIVENINNQVPTIGDLTACKSIPNSLYRNDDASKNIQFAVERLDVPSQVLDPRINRIAVGKNTEFHRHAHETVIHLLEGEANVLINEVTLSLKKGDTVLVPRWCDHQTFNTGNQELSFLAVTDYKLTRQFPGNSDESYRSKKMTSKFSLVEE